ncbi:MAG: hypothetical protein N3G21_05195 [Candidatus Hydrogenedentes bacterium]|nr:hypothetical protein [Candidatus Hydrogenedentota bacterium]
MEIIFRLLNIVAWLVFFALGASPEDTFNFLRIVSGVTVWEALINSPWAITVALTLYYSHFIYHRCVESQLPKFESLMKSIQTGLMAFLAFLPLRPDFDLYKNMVHQEHIKVIYLILTLKVFFWIFLLTIVVFYYLNGNKVFKKLPDLFLDLYPVLNKKDKKNISNHIP